MEGDTPFLEALLGTWQASQVPQAATIAAGATPPRPNATLEFRW